MDYQGYRILIVDDEKDILEFLSYNIRREGFEVFTERNGQDALKTAGRVKPHLIILDVMMPGMDGMETCVELRKMEGLRDSIILFLTARSEDYSQIAGFDAGADDYVAKPVKPKVLVSRIKALLRRAGGSAAPETGIKVIEAGRIQIDRERYLVLLDGKEYFLPRKEFELLSLLASRPNKVFSRDEIFSGVWGDSVIVGDRTIDVHIRKIREKLGDDMISTVKGVGYKFEA
jgi:two-component system, OmpR family, alkaline phosphatase synthesis response regulator PhoP